MVLAVELERALHRAYRRSRRGASLIAYSRGLRLALGIEQKVIHVSVHMHIHMLVCMCLPMLMPTDLPAMMFSSSSFRSGRLLGERAEPTS